MSKTIATTPPRLQRPPKLLNRVRQALCRERYSHRTEQAYIHVVHKGPYAVRSPLDRCTPLAWGLLLAAAFA